MIFVCCLYSEIQSFKVSDSPNDPYVFRNIYFFFLNKEFVTFCCIYINNDLNLFQGILSHRTEIMIGCLFILLIEYSLICYCTSFSANLIQPIKLKKITIDKNKFFYSGGFQTDLVRSVAFMLSKLYKGTNFNISFWPLCKSFIYHSIFIFIKLMSINSFRILRWKRNNSQLQSFKNRSKSSVKKGMKRYILPERFTGNQTTVPKHNTL